MRAIGSEQARVDLFRPNIELGLSQLIIHQIPN
jgi:hypothetical protein